MHLFAGLASADDGGRDPSGKLANTYIASTVSPPI